MSSKINSYDNGTARDSHRIGRFENALDELDIVWNNVMDGTITFTEKVAQENVIYERYELDGETVEDYLSMLMDIPAE